MPVATLGDKKDTYGEIHYLDLPRGYIKITNNFVQDHLVKMYLPYVGRRLVHYRMIDPLLHVLDTIVERSKLDRRYEYIEDIQIYNPRHQWRRKNKPLSMHAWGLALDINPWDNLPGTVGGINQCIVDIFEDNGFKWGGCWWYSDPMHFELII